MLHENAVQVATADTSALRNVLDVDVSRIVIVDKFDGLLYVLIACRPLRRSVSQMVDQFRHKEVETSQHAGFGSRGGTGYIANIG